MILELTIANTTVFARTTQNTNITKTRNLLKKELIRILIEKGLISKEEGTNWIKSIKANKFFEVYSVQDGATEITSIDNTIVENLTFNIPTNQHTLLQVEGLNYNSKITDLKEFKLFIYKNDSNKFVVSEYFSGCQLIECKCKKDVESNLINFIDVICGINKLKEAITDRLNRVLNFNNCNPANGDKIDYNFFIIAEKNIKPVDQKVRDAINIYTNSNNSEFKNFIMVQKSSYTFLLFTYINNKFEFIKQGDKLDLYREFIKDNGYNKDTIYSTKKGSILTYKYDIENYFNSIQTTKEVIEEITVTKNKLILKEIIQVK